MAAAAGADGVVVGGGAGGSYELTLDAGSFRLWAQKAEISLRSTCPLTCGKKRTSHESKLTGSQEETSFQGVLPLSQLVTFTPALRATGGATATGEGSALLA